MKRSQLKPKELENYKKYGIQNCPPYMKRTINAVIIHTQNTKQHEMAKASEAYDRIKMGHKIQTEVWDYKEQKRRDLVDLTEGVVVEIETDKSRAARHGKEYTLMRVVI